MSENCCYTIIGSQPLPKPNVNVVAGGQPPSMLSVRGVVSTSLLWRSSQVLRVRFLEGSDHKKNNVINWAGEWSKYANLFFNFGSNDEDAEIQVKFQPLGNWSMVGTNSLRYKDNGCTMNIQDLLKGTVLHEFGHAIGMQHEHQSPDRSISWNKEVVYRELNGPPNYWNSAEVDNNLFNALDKNQTQFSQLDPKSVMMYPIPGRWTNDGFYTEDNNELSDTDKAFMGAIYPGATVLFSSADIRTARCTVATGEGTMYNQHYGNSWIMNYPGKSFIEVNFQQPKAFQGKSIYSRVDLRLTHLSSAGGDGYQSPVNIVVNGTTIKENYSPPSFGWMEDLFDITAQMKDGDNNIRLEFQTEAQMNYWINTLKVICSGGEPITFTV